MLIGAFTARLFNKLQKLFQGQQILKILTYALVALVLSVIVAYGINEINLILEGPQAMEDSG